MAEINVGILGIGFIGRVHIEAIMRLPGVRLAGLCDENMDLARLVAAEYNCAVYSNFVEMLDDATIDAIHNCTPNHLHFEINRMAIEKGKHILSEKPLAMDSTESTRLLELSRANPSIACGVCFQYRMYPLVQEYKHKIASGELGKTRLIHGRYLQDWLMYDTDYNWRLSKQFAGKTRAIADIGSHWCDLAQTLTGSRITAVMADLVNIIPVRQKPKQEILTFSSANGSVSEPVEIDTEDYGAVMVRFCNGASGIFYVSQVSGGHKCGLEIEINTDKCSIAWCQEDNERMWIGHRDEANRVEIRSALKYAGQYASLPGGHPEGFNDAFKNNLGAFYNYVKGGCKDPSPDFATFEDGHDIMRLVDAIVVSSNTKAWVNI